MGGSKEREVEDCGASEAADENASTLIGFETRSADAWWTWGPSAGELVPHFVIGAVPAMTEGGARDKAERSIRKSRVRDRVFFIGFGWDLTDQPFSVVVDLVGMSRSF